MREREGKDGGRGKGEIKRREREWGREGNDRGRER